jgi:hypothetical protein
MGLWPEEMQLSTSDFLILGIVRKYGIMQLGQLLSQVCTLKKIDSE